MQNKNKPQAFFYASKKIQEVEKMFRTSLKDGLSSQEAGARLLRYGKNQLVSEDIQWWRIVWRQCESPFFYLLLVAVIFALFLGERLDALLILIFIFINTSIGFYQEYRSDQSLKFLNNFIPLRDRALRDGTVQEVDASLLVPGDIIFLTVGDVLPADVRFIETQNITIDEAVLTGESAPIFKSSLTLRRPCKDYYSAKNLGFSGTIVVGGHGKGVIVATGQRAAMGRISALSREIVKESGLSEGLTRLSRFILRMVGGTLIFVFLVNLLLKGNAFNIGSLLIFSIALAVSVIPEALPTVSIFSLARGSLRLAKKKVVVKRLTAIEDLGGIDVLCTDKTGTLTETHLTLADVNADNYERCMFLSNLGGLTMNGARETGLKKNGVMSNSFDSALWKKSGPAMQKEALQYTVRDEMPFDPVRRRNSLIVEGKKGMMLISRGAPEEIMSLCARSKTPFMRMRSWMLEQGKKGRRVLAVASKPLHHMPDGGISSEEQHMFFEGMLSFENAIKTTTFPAIHLAKKMGVQIKMLTGDAPEVAGAVAEQIGVDDAARVMTGKEFMNANGEQQRVFVEQYHVFARVSPEEKHLIVSLLQERHSVGFLGEGMNDGPALKVADVSIVVHGASDVARESADIVLLQKSLHVIIDGIREGRSIFANTLKYIRATLASNFGNFYAVALSSLFINHLPMLPLQIFLLNLLSDFPMIAVATDTVDDDEVRHPQEYHVKEIILSTTILGFVSMFFDFIVFAIYFKADPQILQTNWFLASVVTEIFFLYSIRTKKLFFKARAPSAALSILTLLAFVTTLVLPYTRVGRDLFHFAAPSVQNILTILLIGVLYFMVTEIVKLLYNRFFGNNHHSPIFVRKST